MPVLPAISTGEYRLQNTNNSKENEKKTCYGWGDNRNGKKFRIKTGSKKKRESEI